MIDTSKDKTNLDKSIEWIIKISDKAGDQIVNVEDSTNITIYDFPKKYRENIKKKTFLQEFVEWIRTTIKKYYTDKWVQRLIGFQVLVPVFLMIMIGLYLIIDYIVTVIGEVSEPYAIAVLCLIFGIPLSIAVALLVTSEARDKFNDFGQPKR